MGQAWCKEKSNKAQDSKSPLDRVFLRCAHRIYPSLKEEGSILGGATQRVTSSEIGYASSPPRNVLQRGRSMDSVDRPFHPSDWVDVNLEVPVTPRTTWPAANLNYDPTIYLSSQRTSLHSGPNWRTFSPIPPPRRKKKNRDKVSSAKLDGESLKIHDERVTVDNSNQKPLCLSLKSFTRSGSNEKEIIEHRVNGSGKVISSDVVAGSRSNRDKSSRKSSEKSEEKKHVDGRLKGNSDSSSASLPNFSELNVSGANTFDGEESEKIRKITATGSLPALITSGVLDDLKRSELEKREQVAGTESSRAEDEKFGVDEIDFSSGVSTMCQQENVISTFELEGPVQTWTPLKHSSERQPSFPDSIKESETMNLSINKPDQYGSTKTAPLLDFQQKESRNDVFYDVDENKTRSEENRGGDTAVEKADDTRRRRISLPKEENEAMDSSWNEKEDQAHSTIVRSNSDVKHLGRTISEESLPQEMLDSDNDFEKESMKYSDEGTKPQPASSRAVSDERAKIFDSDHSTLLKVLRDEAEESNLSSMTPSLTELEAALSDMLEREDDRVTKENTTEVKNPEIISNDDDFKISAPPVSLKNIFQLSKNCDKSDSPSVETLPTGEPPEKPSRLRQNIAGDEDAEKSSSVPTPPRRKNRYSGQSRDQRSLERNSSLMAADDSPHNDRLI